MQFDFCDCDRKSQLLRLRSIRALEPEVLMSAIADLLVYKRNTNL
ncbi:hypothetical protein [Nostoc punctiforme]|nr:hypothetical protein [Nostoc punctiforme]